MQINELKQHYGSMLYAYSVPAILSMVMTTMITFSDGFFTGNRIGKEGLAAINLGLPLVYLQLAVALTVSVGGSVIASIVYGAKREAQCTTVFRQTMATSILFSLLLSCVSPLSFAPALKALHAGELLSSLFHSYWTIMLVSMPLTTFGSSASMFIRSEGNPRFPFMINILSVFLNIALDALFTIVFPWGIKGIAWASVIAQGFGAICYVVYFLKKSQLFTFGRFSFDKQLLKTTLLNGSSEGIGELSSCITMAAYNAVIMRHYGSDGVTAFTIGGYVAYLFSMIAIGFGQGAVPLVSFAFGAKDRDLVKAIKQKSCQAVFVAALVIVTIMEFFAERYSQIFAKDPAIIQVATAGIRVFVLAFLCSGYNTITSFCLTATGEAKPSAVISFSRGLLILFPAIILLPLLFGMQGIFLAAPLTELLTLFISLHYRSR